MSELNDAKPVKKVGFTGVPTDVPDLPKTMYPVTPKTEEFVSVLTPTKNDMDLIIPNLYLGDISAAHDVEKLKSLNITHVLTIEDNSLDSSVYKKFDKYKFKKLADHQFSDILAVFEECLTFIDEAIKEGNNILVHCFAGMSRSATLVLAYIMSKEKQSVKKTLDQVRKNRFVRPNMGFYKQLELFQAMDWTVNKTSPVYRAFKLENMSRQIQLGNVFSLIEKTNGSSSTDDNNNSDNLACYKCKKCRYTLFSADKVVPHIKKFDKDSLNSWKKKLAYFQQLKLSANLGETDEDPECRAELYIEPLDWFKDRLEDMSGKLNCPKCDAKVGSFDWCGTICSCQTWVTPADRKSVV